MTKEKSEEGVSPMVALFGNASVEVKSRGDSSQTFKATIVDFHPTGLLHAVKAGVSDLLNGQAMATLTKPAREDFASAAEYTDALEEYKGEKENRKVAMWNGLHTGTIPVFPAKAWTSPLRQEIDRIVHADLTTYFGNSPVRQSFPTMAYALPDRKSEAYASHAKKWLAKYGTEITAEATENLANGVVTSPTLSPAAADLEF